MPTYEYKCTDCGYRFTQFQNMNDLPVHSCPQCDKPVKRLISAGSAVLFKGSGFHATDYPSHSRSGCCGSHEKTPCDKPKRCCDKNK